MILASQNGTPGYKELSYGSEHSIIVSFNGIRSTQIPDQLIDSDVLLLPQQYSWMGLHLKDEDGKWTPAQRYIAGIKGEDFIITDGHTNFMLMAPEYIIFHESFPEAAARQRIQSHGEQIVVA